MRSDRPRLATLNPSVVALELAGHLLGRLVRDSLRLRPALVVSMHVGGVPFSGSTEPAQLRLALEQSEVYRSALALVGWAQQGTGTTEHAAELLRAVMEDLDGPALPGAAPRAGLGSIERAPSTSWDVVRVAAAARIALYQAQPVTALELATLASVDERTIRAAASEGRLKPLDAKRPMRFDAVSALVELARRRVPGFPELLQGLKVEINSTPNGSQGPSM